MHILLTRPLEDCSEMILKFQSLGNIVSHLPLLKIDKVSYDEFDLLNLKGIIFTSANAVKYLNIKKIDKKLPCFCVGNATEKKVRSVGFQNVITAEGNAENLKIILVLNKDQVILHFHFLLFFFHNILNFHPTKKVLLPIQFHYHV